MDTFLSTSAKIPAVLALVLLSALASGEEATTVSGQLLAGSLSGSAGNMDFAAPNRRVGLDQLARITFKDPGDPVPLVAGVVTREGSVVRGTVTVGQGGGISVSSPRLGVLEAPLSEIARLYFQCRRPISNPSERGIHLRNGDFLSADTIVVNVDSLSAHSILGDVEVPLKRVAAVTLRALDAPRRQAGDVSVLLENDDVLKGDLVSRDASLVVATAFGEVAVEPGHVCRVDFPARVKYISELPLTVSTRGVAPEGIKYVFLDEAPEGPLSANGLTWRKGIYMRSGAAIEVALPAGGQRLFFVPAAAESARPPYGTLTIEADGAKLFSAVINGDARPEPAILDVSGRKSISLFFRSEPDGLIGSAVVLGDALVTVSPIRKE